MTHRRLVSGLNERWHRVVCWFFVCVFIDPTWGTHSVSVTMLPSLTPDVWILIQCFACSTALLRANRWLFDTIGGVVFLRYNIGDDTVDAALRDLAAHADVRLLDLGFSFARPASAGTVARVAAACRGGRPAFMCLWSTVPDARPFVSACGPHLRQLSVTLHDNFGAADVRELLCGMRSLERLRITLGRRTVDAEFAAALASLAQLPELGTLKIEFAERTPVLDADCMRTLFGVCLGAPPQLVAFSLKAFDACVSDADWRSLAVVARRPLGSGGGVRRLSLLLENTDTHDDTVVGLVDAILRDLPALQRVTFRVCPLRLSGRSFRRLGLLGQRQRHLSLAFVYDGHEARAVVTENQLRELFGDAELWTVDTLCLDLFSTGVTNAIVDAIAEGLRRGVPRLRRLELMLSDNAITDLGALRLAGAIAHHRGRLTSLKVYLSQNLIGNDGAQSLFHAAAGVPQVEIHLRYNAQTNQTLVRP